MSKPSPTYRDLALAAVHLHRHASPVPSLLIVEGPASNYHLQRAEGLSVGEVAGQSQPGACAPLRTFTASLESAITAEKA